MSKARYIFETSIGFFVMGLSIYLYLQLPNQNPPPAVIGTFLVGFAGAFSPFIKVNKSKSVNVFLKQVGWFFHGSAIVIALLGVASMFIANTALGFLMAILLAAFIYAVGSGIKSV